MKKLILNLLLFIASNCLAQNIFKDSFSYNFDTQLSGQGSWTNNSSLPGGLGAAVPAGINNTQVKINPVIYPDYGGSDFSIEIKSDADGCGRGFTGVTSGNFYVSFVLSLSATQANNNSDFFRVMSGDNYNTSFRLYATPSSGAFFLGVAKGANGNPISTSNLSYNLNQDHLIIIKYTIGSGTNDDLVSVYVDPVYANGEPSSPTIQSNSGLDQLNSITGIDRLCFRQNWSNGMPTGKAGLVSVAYTWADLTFNLATQQFNKDNFTIATSQVANGVLNIKSDVLIENAKLSIYDIQGRIIETKTITLEDTINDVSINPISNKGVYIVKITSRDNKSYSQKIIIQ